MTESTFTAHLDTVLSGVREMLISKNKAYGNSALSPMRVFSRASTGEQINVRMDDKLSRIRNGDTTEDAKLDLLGYLVIDRVRVLEEKAGEL